MAAMEPVHQRSYRGSRPNGHLDTGGPARRAHHGNRRWLADGVTSRSGTSTPNPETDSERWERGGHRGSGRGRGRGSRGKFNNPSVAFRPTGALGGGTTGSEGERSEAEEEHEVEEIELSGQETPEEREKFWQELVKAREAERKKAISEGKMDDPLKPKRLEDAITMVGTCEDMCPRFERYRRERENNLFEWEMIPGTKRVDHKRAVKAYERAAGDKTLPSDLRPPDVLKRTLDYLFHELLPHGGFSETFNFIRDRSRAIRNDFTMQHEMGPIAIECHDRCARFHILALHVERDRPGFSIAMEEQQLMNSLQSLKEFYEDQRGRYQSPTELEMRVYHRLIHIRDQKERHDDIPQALLDHPVFELTTRFRARVQANSAPITKASPLSVDVDAMGIFAELADVLRREGNLVMTYLVACILERHFGKDTIDDIESIRGDLSFSDIIDGKIGVPEPDTDIDISAIEESEGQVEHPATVPLEPPGQLNPSDKQWPTNTFGPKLPLSSFFTTSASQPFAPANSAFSNLKTIPNAFGATSFGTQSAFQTMNVTSPSLSVFGSMVQDNVMTSSPPPHTIAASNASPGFQSSPSTTSFLPFNPTLPTAQAIISAPQMCSTQTPLAQASEITGSLRRSFSGSETPSKPLNPLAPTFTPSPTRITPICTQPTRDQDIPDMTSPKIPLVPSPPSTIPADGMIDQTPQLHPPPLSRRQPISLPSTPVASTHIPSPLTLTQRPTLPSLKNLQTNSISILPTEILSPLILQSPISKAIPGLRRKESVQSSLKAAISTTDAQTEAKSKPENSLAAEPPPTGKLALDIMDTTALHFARRSWLMKQAFINWRQRLSDHVKWIEACRRSTDYKEKARTERLSRSTGAPFQGVHAGRKIPPESRVPLKKRLRERLSGEYRPHTSDEELVKRFEKNHEDHARRWARGSLLGILREVLVSTKKPFPDSWSVWLSLNQESDGTAIWLEQKFDVPDSGQWRNESVFEIPVSQVRDTLGYSYPGIVIFECTPLTSITDILGRKYRVLEDCTRLREVIEAFPVDRHCVPSLLCIAWSERDPDSSKDFDDMVQSFIEGGMLTSTHELVISTAALDMESKLAEALRSIPFDFEGRLVKLVSLNDLFKTWERQWEDTTAGWLSDCVVYGSFNWDVYAKLLESCTHLLIRIIDSVIGLLRSDSLPSGLVHLQVTKGMDSDTTFDVVLGWLQSVPETDYTSLLSGDIRAHQSLGRDFPAMTFTSQLYALGSSIAGHVAEKRPDATQFVPRSQLDKASKEIQSLKMMLDEEMNAYRITKLKPAKRHASFGEPSWSRASPPRLKKQRLSSASDESPTDEEATSPSLSSPPLSTATSVPSEPAQTAVVTSAMLRSLTKDIRTKYGVAPTNSLSASFSR